MDERDMEEEGNDRGEGWSIGIKNVSMYCGIQKPVGQIKHLFSGRYRGNLILKNIPGVL
jgi:hypothetical protein